MEFASELGPTIRESPKGIFPSPVKRDRGRGIETFGAQARSHELAPGRRHSLCHIRNSVHSAVTDMTATGTHR